MPVITFILNGRTVSVDADEDEELLWVLNDRLGVRGPKYGCGLGACGACTSHIDGIAVRTCVVAVGGIAGHEVTTIEGIAAEGTLHPVQAAWVHDDVAQCGYCQAGQIMQAISLLRENPNPTDDEIDGAMSGNLCRCGTYFRIRSAIRKVAAGHYASGRQASPDSLTSPWGTVGG